MPLGVMMSNSDCSGQNDTDDCGTRVSPGLSRRRMLFSHAEGLP